MYTFKPAGVIFARRRPNQKQRHNALKRIRNRGAVERRFERTAHEAIAEMERIKKLIAKHGEQNIKLNHHSRRRLAAMNLLRDRHDMTGYGLAHTYPARCSSLVKLWRKQRIAAGKRPVRVGLRTVSEPVASIEAA